MTAAILPRLVQRKPWDRRPGVAFLDVRDGQCRYPLWSAEDRSPPSQRFVCGAPVVERTSYCRDHKLVCLREVPEADEAAA